MLVLTRKVEEKIRIGDDITITILRVRGNAVRVGVEAPRNVRVLRAELPPHEDSADPDSTQPDNLTADIAETEPMIGGSIRPKSALVRDRSSAGSKSARPSTFESRTSGRAGNSSPVSRTQPPTVRIVTGLAERVAARRGTMATSVESEIVQRS